MGTGNELIAGCLAIYNRTPTVNNFSSLLGVQCMDVSMIIPTANFKAKSDFVTLAWPKMVADGQKCYRAQHSEALLEELRLTESGCAAVCSASVPEECDVSAGARPSAARVLLFSAWAA